MAVPFRKTSKTRKNKRRTHIKLRVPGMVECPECGEMKLSHRVCKACGTYKGRDVASK
ncbi:50S ribosomal protein L32 [Alkalicoccus daliensis]|uniref:Large ribosomal subunit protein bL32 n=1 Tax=Alkalicoccus daliensis TaxID=745820 RepID=A0A1G9ZU33_9BACI|nr:50S ribosomal protein L32 [Alkalicoccus daliensis]SDN24625.1 LSU ribosomal protein L32P [Alkalicoccus daliensis]